MAVLLGVLISLAIYLFAFSVLGLLDEVGSCQKQEKIEEKNAERAIGFGDW
jgi:hypothetical protein